MISVLQAQETIDGHVAALGSEPVALDLAHGRLLREPVASAEDLPPFDRSAMDGYAIRLDDGAKEFEIVAEIRAGQSLDLQLQPGRAVRILTGARLPGPNLKVVMQEDTQVEGKRLQVTKPSAATHVRKRGEDARSGEVLLQPGRFLDATSVALLASVGKTVVEVSRRPRILHLTTGDEIVPPDRVPAEGQIRNSNASLITALCGEQGIDAVTHVHSGDDLADLLRIVAEAKVDTHDMVLISGGSGQGTYDFSAEIFQHLKAAIHFRQVNVRPGKPLIFGTNTSQVVFGLPGNALSHFVCFHLFVLRALERLMARAVAAPARAILADALSDTSNARETWWPVQTIFSEGRLECHALPWKSSGDITRLPGANALMKVPASTSRLDAGTMVEILFTRHFSD